MNKVHVTCPSCKGKGHVLDAESLIDPINLVLSFFDRNDKYGETRQRCYQCFGSGYVSRPKN